MPGRWVIPVRDSQRLRVYKWEDQAFLYRGSQLDGILLDSEEAVKLLSKLSAKFSVSVPVVWWWKGRGGSYIRFGQIIRINKKPTMGVVLHEFAHHLARNLFRGDSEIEAHGPEFVRTLIEVVRAAGGTYTPVPVKKRLRVTSKPDFVKIRLARSSMTSVNLTRLVKSRTAKFLPSA